MPSGNPQLDARRRLLDVVEPIVIAAGFDLEDLTIQAIGRRSVVRLVVDSDAGVDLDEVAALSRDVSELLDSEPGADAFGDSYVLEVSSPGVDRPLTHERHWRRAIGRLVVVRVEDVPVTARVLATSTDGVTLSVEGVDRPITWAALGPGKVQIEFNPVGFDRASPHNGSGGVGEDADIVDDVQTEEG